MRNSEKKTLSWLKLFLIMVALYALLRVVLLPLVTSEKFRLFTDSLGLWGYFVVIGYIVASHVFAPLAGTPGVLLGVTIYGIRIGMILIYLASLISAVINFWISRRFGRKWVAKLAGKKSMKQIDEFAATEGKQALWISRLFGFSIFEFVSYAAGLTMISFKDYFVITAVASIFTSLAGYFVFRKADFQSEIGIMIWIIFIIFAGAIFGFLIKAYLKRRRRQQSKADC